MKITSQTYTVIGGVVVTDTNFDLNNYDFEK